MRKIFLYLILSASFSSKATSASALALREAGNAISVPIISNQIGDAALNAMSAYPSKQFSWIERLLNNFTGATTEMANQAVNIITQNTQIIAKDIQIATKDLKIAELTAHINLQNTLLMEKDNQLATKNTLLITGSIIVIMAAPNIYRLIKNQLQTISDLKNSLHQTSNELHNLSNQNMLLNEANQHLKSENERSLDLVEFERNRSNELHKNVSTILEECNILRLKLQSKISLEQLNVSLENQQLKDELATLKQLLIGLLAKVEPNTFCCSHNGKNGCKIHGTFKLFN